MSRLRSLIVLLALGCAFGVGVPCAGATDPFPVTGITVLSNEYFQIHYTRNDALTNAFITQEKAGDVLGMARRAYNLFLSWGYPAPALDTTDGNGLIDISVDDFCGMMISYARGLTTPASNLGPPNNIDSAIPRDNSGRFCRWNALTNTTTPDAAGEIHLDATTGLDYHTIAHEVFTLFERKIAPTSAPWRDPWLTEGTAEWAAYRAESFLTPTEADMGQNPDRTADCVGAECGDTEIDKNGYPGWLLFERLAERYGTDAVKAVWDDAASNPSESGVTALSNVLVGKGTTLSAFFNDYAVKRLTGGFDLPTLKDKLPPAQATLTAPDTNGTLPTTYVAVNHLAARYVSIRHSSSTNLRAPCYAASLALKVTLPAGVTSTPYYYANTYGATAQAFTLSGTTASLTVPWNSCASSPDAFISLANDSWNPGLDGREFQVDGTVSVDLNTPASPSGPSGAVVTGPVVATPTEAPAPTLKLYAPEVLRVNASTRLLRFVVFASGEGQLHAVLGPTDLGKADLRTGNNDIRFTLPKSLVTALRKTSARSVLTLTSVAPNGDSGDSITRRVLIQPAAKKKKKTVKHR